MSRGREKMGADLLNNFCYYIFLATPANRSKFCLVLGVQISFYGFAKDGGNSFKSHRPSCIYIFMWKRYHFPFPYQPFLTPVTKNASPVWRYQTWEELVETLGVSQQMISNFLKVMCIVTTPFLSSRIMVKRHIYHLK